MICDVVQNLHVVLWYFKVGVHNILVPIQLSANIWVSFFLNDQLSVLAITVFLIVQAKFFSVFRFRFVII